ncbi:MAG: AraC family transcriptional regulator, partial [Leptospirales bacterium]
RGAIESAILHKSLQEPMHDQAVFTRTPSLTFITAGEKIISATHNRNERFSIRPGEILALPADLYQISDLLIEDRGRFESLIVFIEPAVLAAFARTLPVRNVRETFRESQAFRVNAMLPMRSSQSVELWRGSLRPLFRSLNSHPPLRTGDARPAEDRADPGRLYASLMRTKLIEGLQLLYLNNPELGDWARRMCAPPDGERARDLREFMLQHFDRPLSVEDFAQLTGRSNSTFLRDFKRCFGQTPRDWLLERRMDRARVMIEAGRTNITDIAADLGYESISHFIRNFKRRFGKTPGNWVRAFYP